MQPRRSAEQADMGEDSVNTEEQTFLFGLHKFMHDSKMPIGRIPSLGFKQSQFICFILFLICFIVFDILFAGIVARSVIND